MSESDEIKTILAPFVLPPNSEFSEEVGAKVLAWIEEVKRRCYAIGKPIRDDEVRAAIEGEFIYVMANPIVAHETIMAGTPFERRVPRRNLEMAYQPQILVPFDEAPEAERSLYDRVPLGMRPERIAVPNPQPFKLRPILLPYILVRLTLDGELDADGATSFDFPIQ